MVQKSKHQDEPIDIIFMDAQMTHVHGPEAAATIREMGYVGVIVAVSGNIMDEDVARYKKCGADLYLTKPLDLDKVEEVVTGMHAELTNEI